jgi:hypothetical protein
MTFEEVLSAHLPSPAKVFQLTVERKTHWFKVLLSSIYGQVDFI